MDAISIIQTVLPIVIGLPFTFYALFEFKQVMLQEIDGILAPVWCLLSSIIWFSAGVVNIYAVTTDYLANFGWLFLGIGLLLFILMWVSLFMSIKLVARTNANKKEDEEMRLQ